MLTQNYPEENWNILDFRKNIPLEYWNIDENIKQWAKSFEQEHMIKNPSDWYRISRKQVSQAKGQGILTNFGPTPNFLRHLYPHHDWNFDGKHNKHKRAAQRRLFVHVKRLFPGEEVIEEFRHQELSRQSGATVEFDVFLPSLSLAFEYHGQHHYEELAAWCGIEMQQYRDKEKLRLCKAAGIKLIVIPYWWDESKSALIEKLEQENVLHVKE